MCIVCKNECWFNFRSNRLQISLISKLLKIGQSISHVHSKPEKTSKILKLFGSSVSASIRWWISYNIMTSNALTTLMYLSFFILVCICWKWMKISAARRYTFMKENIHFSIRSWNPSVANSQAIVNSTNKYAFISRIFNRHEANIRRLWPETSKRVNQSLSSVHFTLLLNAIELKHN